MTADEVIAEHIRFVTEESSRIRTGSIPARLGIPYGDSDRERVDIFGTDLPDDAPIFVYFSGGYWQMMSGDISAYVVEPMYSANVVTVIVDYTRAPGSKFFKLSIFMLFYLSGCLFVFHFLQSLLTCPAATGR